MCVCELVYCKDYCQRGRFSHHPRTGGDFAWCIDFHPFLVRFMKGAFITKPVAVVAFNQRKSWDEIDIGLLPHTGCHSPKGLLDTFFWLVDPELNLHLPLLLGRGLHPKIDICSFSQVLLCILGVLYACDTWMNQLLKADSQYVFDVRILQLGQSKSICTL